MYVIHTKLFKLDHIKALCIFLILLNINYTSINNFISFSYFQLPLSYNFGEFALGLLFDYAAELKQTILLIVDIGKYMILKVVCLS